MASHRNWPHVCGSLCWRHCAVRVTEPSVMDYGLQGVPGFNLIFELYPVFIDSSPSLKT